jgi:hypothetical protein
LKETTDKCQWSLLLFLLRVSWDSTLVLDLDSGEKGNLFCVAYAPDQVAAVIANQ